MDEGSLACAADRGIWDSEHAYICEQIGEHLPRFLAWLLDCCEPGALRAGYTAGKLRVWSTPTADGRVRVFEADA